MAKGKTKGTAKSKTQKVVNAMQNNEFESNSSVSNSNSNHSAERVRKGVILGVSFQIIFKGSCWGKKNPLIKE